MASPITWQTIQGRSLGEAAVPMHYAAQSIMGGFDRMGKAFDEQQAIAQKQLNTADEANVQGFLDRLQQARTPEEVAALEASGEMDAYTGAINNKALLEKLRGGYASRTAGLMQQTTAQNAFADQQLARDRLPGIAQANDFIARNDKAGLEQFLGTVDLGLEESKLLDRAYDRYRTRANDARADELAPLTHTNNLNAAKEVQRVQADTEAARTLDAVLAQALQKRDAAENPNLSTSPVNTGFTAPVPKDAAEAEALHQSILRGGKGLTPAGTSDTDMANAALRQITESGQFTPAFLEKNMGRIRGAFDSTSRGARVGNDAATRARENAMERVEFDEKMKDNWSAPGTPDVKNRYESLAKEVPNLIDRSTGTSIDEDIPFIQEKLSELAVKGIQVHKGVYVTPSENEVRMALRTAKGADWWNGGDKARARDFMSRLKEIMKSGNLDERMQDAERLKQTARKFAVQELLDAKK